MPKHKTSLTQQVIHSFLRSFLVGSRSQRQAGFVLPTTVLLLLVVGLTVTALLFRCLSRTNQVIGQLQQQEIYNAATPAIDRAKAKLENLFTNDERYPIGLPSEDFLANTMMPDDRYNLPDETRLDLNGDGTADNAWVYKDAETGNTIAYSILMKTQGQVNGNNVDIKSSNQNKAAAMVVRTGPISTAQLNSACLLQNNQLEQGWFKDGSSSSFLRKNFQVNAVVLNKNALTKPVATLELQQDRKVDRGNKWGAWFRYDLEIYPGASLNWNGALHTEGSLFLGDQGNQFKAYLISSPASCLYGKNGIEASELSINQKVENGITTFQGQIVSGSMHLNNQAPDYGFRANSATIHRSPSSSTQVKKAEDSVKDSGTTPEQLQPADIALDPLLIFTEDKSRSRNANDPSNTTIRDTQNWDNSNPLVKGNTARIFNKQVPTPYLDDTYRADNRYGPKLPKGGLPTGKKVGDPIPITDSELVSNTPPTDNPEKLGLDGYWERRARNQGLRVIVGQRLELGNPLGVPTSLPAARPHEALQRRALRDNLAAVQATAIYHHEHNKNFPIVCLATTVHPGTAQTSRRSATFETITFKNSSDNDVTLYSDFFTGRGTNGWEYEVPASATFPNASVQKVLQNLAYFAGDPDGAYPAKQEASTATTVHPYPELTKWGDFSNLRRALGGTYANLSTADQSYYHTAACTLGMLADNIKVLQDYDYANNNNWDTVTDESTPKLLDNLNTELGTAVYSGISDRSPAQTIATLEQQGKTKLAQLARLIYLKEQVELDRTNAQGYGGSGYVCNANKFYSVGAGATNVVKLCPSWNQGTNTSGYDAGDVQYLALYYIFPTRDHGEARTDSYITNASVNPATTTDLYKGIGGSTYDAALDNAALESIRLRPRTIGTGGTWTLDTQVVASPGTAAPNDRQNGLIRYVDSSGTATVYRVPFKDAALFDGREMMNVRVLNVDLDLLRQNKPGIGDTWLPISGIIYAFREDAVREDAIARPAIATWSDYKTAWNSNPASGPPLNGAGTITWRMDARLTSRKDPPLNADTGISPKPIDYYADPDRRPYGFRLKNGSNITRLGADNTYGLSFISDNPVYIQGDVNLHQNSSGTRLEEFSQHLQDNWGNFYTRTSLDPQFATAADSWRPTEILADAVTILSNNFCDGSIQDGFLTAGTATVDSAPAVALEQYGCGTGNGYTSYLNQNRPSTVVSNWQRENPTDPNSPIRISENGVPFTNNGSYSNDYYDFTTDKLTTSTRPANTRVNAIIVSGIVPSRAMQSYGGFHNFPRLVENWKISDTQRINLFISGSFIQLNFSSYATGPFDQDDWEPYQTASSINEERIKYYKPPNRRWGYDVGLQYQPPAAVLRRFTVPSSTRSEFYKELPVDDPYILQLRCATEVGGTEQVDPHASCS